MTTSAGEYMEEVEVHGELPYQVAAGINNVALGSNVTLSAPEADTYAWTLTAPAGSDAELTDATSRIPAFTADVEGEYTVGEGEAEFVVYAGKFAGAISGIDEDGLPKSASCTTCHAEGGNIDQFTPWKQSGHAHILTNNINTSTHYSTGCFSCHTVGFNGVEGDGGIDDAADWDAFIEADLFHDVKMENWGIVVDDFPTVAKLANIQCENCHGPNADGAAHHSSADRGRTSLSSDVCATCHGEPLRHARFQQWEESGHSNYALAESYASNGNCGRCHSGNGFVAWTKSGDWEASLDTEALGISAANAHPQTCATCHFTHDVGTKTGDGNDANLRVYGDSPMLQAGFKAVGMGNGALCITCHNARRGLIGDDISTPAGGRAPHGGPHGDVFMGMNAYFVKGLRSPHSYIKDTCTNCHMELEDPPADLSYKLGGTNHTFTASTAVCANCHGIFDGGTLAEATEGVAHELAERLMEYAHIKFEAAGTVWVEGEEGVVELDYDEIHPTTGHGRQAIHTIKGEMEDHFQLRKAWMDAGDDGEGNWTLEDADGVYTEEDEGFPIFDDENDDDIKFYKAGWNYHLIHYDNSHGAHNPSFTFELLEAAIAAMDELLAVD